MRSTPPITRETLLVTPSVAEQLLGKNTKNRNLKASHVAYLAGQMTRGEWMYTGDPIRIDVTGRLIDGQHRLHAVIKADAQITFDVVRGLPPETQDVIDTGAKRSAADLLTLADHPNATTLAAAARVLFAYRDGRLVHAMSSVPPSRAPSHVQLRELVDSTPLLADGVRAAMRMAKTCRLPAGPAGAAWTVLAEMDAGRATEFYDAVYRLDGSAAVATLVRRVMADRAQKTRYEPATPLFYIFRSWNAWVADEPITKLLLGSGAKGWTKLPEPINPAGANS